MRTVSIGHEKVSDIFFKYHLENLGTAMVIHEFTEPEPIDADAHNHPGDFISIIYKGWYIERVWSYNLNSCQWDYLDIRRQENTMHLVKAETIHQLIDVSPGGCITIAKFQPGRQQFRFFRFKDGKAWSKAPDEENYKREYYQ